MWLSFEDAKAWKTESTKVYFWEGCSAGHMPEELVLFRRNAILDSVRAKKVRDGKHKFLFSYSKLAKSKGTLLPLPARYLLAIPVN